MAVVQTSSYRYVGLAADDKPTEGVVVGSRFVETDTGAEYEYAGLVGDEEPEPTWVEVTPQARAAAE